MFEGRDLLRLDNNEIKRVRGKSISMVFQEPRIALNPIIPVGEQVRDVIMTHQGLDKKEASSKVLDLFREVALPDPEDILRSYPFELSGGMCQRVMIAMALSSNPKLIIADEPTSALDVTIQSQILSLISNLRREKRFTPIILSHDLGVISEVCDRVAVMYGGVVVETGSVYEIFDGPLHPYTQGLIRCIPRITDKSMRLQEIYGSVAELFSPPKVCIFESRCPYAKEICRMERPASQTFGSHIVDCHLYS